VISESASPGKKWAAAILQRRCGPESAFFTRVNVRRAGPLRRGFFTGQTVNGTVFLLEEDAAEAGISLLWTADKTLTVRCPHCAAALVHQQDQQWGPIKIEYDLR
jgi:hypothetical protein